MRAAAVVAFGAPRGHTVKKARPVPRYGPLTASLRCRVLIVHHTAYSTRSVRACQVFFPRLSRRSSQATISNRIGTNSAAPRINTTSNQPMIFSAKTAIRRDYRYGVIGGIAFVRSIAAWSFSLPASVR